MSKETTCKNCNAVYASSAASCPKCGHTESKPVEIEPKKISFLLGLGIFCIPYVFAWKLLEEGYSKKQRYYAFGWMVFYIILVGLKEPRGIVQLDNRWYYEHSPDEMSKGTSHHATVSSTNTVEFQFPYSGAQRARLDLRSHPRYGENVMLSIKKGQFLCRSYDPCDVLVRFDNEPASNYSAVGPDDHSTTTIFINNYDQFVGKMVKAKRVRISTPIYQEGAPVFEFDVSGFDQSLYNK